MKLDKYRRNKMKTRALHLFNFLIVLLLFAGCAGKKEHKNSITMGVPSDIESTNPMFTVGTTDTNIGELLYLSLVKHTWNIAKGDIDTKLMLAKEIKWNSDSTEIEVQLRDDVYWSDGKKFTADDVVFSFDVYSDPAAETRFLGMFRNYILDDNGKIDTGKSFIVRSPYSFTIKFAQGSKPDLYDIDYPIIPKHIFGNVNRKELAAQEKNLPAAVTGPFKVDKWVRDQFISLKVNTKSVLYSKDNLDKIIFKVIPDINNRVVQLNTGEIDLAENLRPDNLAALKNNSNLVIAPVKGRVYEYVAWNQLDPARKGSPNFYFSSSKVRQALTYAINREEILNEFLSGYGELAVGPVAPIFKNAINPALKPYPFDPVKAKSLLAEEGWGDKDGNGIIEKNGKEFVFDLNYLPDKPHRKNAVEVIKNNLAAVGIKVNPVPVEKGAFLDYMFSGKFNAWLAAWGVPVPLELVQYWHSDKELGHLNLTGYKNPEADRILSALAVTKNEDVKNELYKKFQEIIYNDEPFTFMFWTDNIAVYNKRIIKPELTPLSILQNCWSWQTEN